MAEVLSTTVSALHRSISVLLDDGRVERFALAESSDGAVAWRRDTFTTDEGAPGVQSWVRHAGRLSVAQVAACVPRCRRQIVAWTREEVDLGCFDPAQDIFARDARGRALARLAAELAELEPPPVIGGAGEVPSAVA